MRSPLDPTRKFSEGGGIRHRAALEFDCPTCKATKGEWCPMPGTTWALCSERIALTQLEFELLAKESKP